MWHSTHPTKSLLMYFSNVFFYMTPAFSSSSVGRTGTSRPTRYSRRNRDRPPGTQGALYRPIVTESEASKHVIPLSRLNLIHICLRHTGRRRHPGALGATGSSGSRWTRTSGREASNARSDNQKVKSVKLHLQRGCRMKGSGGRRWCVSLFPCWWFSDRVYYTNRMQLDVPSHALVVAVYHNTHLKKSGGTFQATDCKLQGLLLAGWASSLIQYWCCCLELFVVTTAPV